MSRLFLITVASWCWTFIRVVPALCYSLRITSAVVKQAAINFALFALIAVPSSLAMDFTRWNPRWPGIVPFLLSYLEIFLFIALLEELFFRGFPAEPAFRVRCDPGSPLRRLCQSSLDYFIFSTRRFRTGATWRWRRWQDGFTDRPSGPPAA